MTGYPIMEPPFLSFPIEEMKKKQVEQYFNRYMTQIEGNLINLLTWKRKILYLIRHPNQDNV